MKPQKFSKKTLDFLVKANKQKNPLWLDKNQNEYETVLKAPFIQLAQNVKTHLQHLARDYHFPSKGLARIKRPEFKVAGGQDLYKDWVSMIASRPSGSRFESNPHLFFGLFPNEDDKVILAAGLWQPSSSQTRALREAIAKNSKPFHQLFADKSFKSSFKNGFYDKELSLRAPRGFDKDHPDMDWIRLKRFIVYKNIPMKDFVSPQLSQMVIRDFKQALRFNELIELAIKWQWFETEKGK